MPKPFLHRILKMPSNVKGGKGYKKGKHTDSEPQMIECDSSQNQMYGRVMKSLGNRRFRIFCNDNKERICRICGSMRKSQWVEEKLLVLISIRDLYNTTESLQTTETGDIIGLIDTGLYGKMKKLPGINPLLFVDDRVKDKVDDIFDRGEVSDSEGEDGSASAGEEGEEVADAEKRKEKVKQREAEITARRNAKYADVIPSASLVESAEDDLNVDDI